jgi:transposase
MLCWVIRDLVVPAASPAMSAVHTESGSKFKPFVTARPLLWVDGTARDVIEAPKLEPWIVRYELSDFEWAAIKPFLPNKSRLVRRVNDRRVLNGIFWVLRSGRTMARSAGLLWPTHHLLQPFRPVAKGRSMGPDHGLTCRRSRCGRPNDRYVHRARTSARRLHR